MREKIVENYSDIFSTFQEFKGESLEKHVEKLKQVDQLIPHSATFFCITNTSDQSFEYVSKNFHPTMKLPIDEMCTRGMEFWWGRMHPEEMETWLQSLKDLMIFTMSNIALEDRRRMTYTWNYRVKDGEGIYKNIIQHTTPMFFDDEGKPIIGLAHYSVLEAHEILPIQATAKILNANDEYETLFYQMYGDQKLLVDDISHRERDVLRLLSFGFSNDDISDKLNISAHTVKTHRKNVMTKTGCKNTTQLVAMCIRQGII
ncbi:regulatory protein, luxR family [Ekhidna lutea]|uniref:Regulatory protein, luxR family n=1 Tax=Ekhidna lutea TaxID=447679 RepID=A0A239J094_EKHLU|nr:helix-turn-helix transcriptional regulator [Ekhidna lutea]SNS99321.1 regulatory protein, luxR family [Ekhidna lutea]